MLSGSLPSVSMNSLTAFQASRNGMNRPTESGVPCSVFTNSPMRLRFAFRNIIVAVPDPAIPLLEGKINAQIGISKHVQGDFDLIDLGQTIRAGESLYSHAPAIVATVIRPFLSLGREEKWLELANGRPAAAVERAKVNVPFHFHLP